MSSSSDEPSVRKVSFLFLALASGLIVLGVAQPASAQAEQEANTAAVRRVQITLVGLSPSASDFGKLVEEWFPAASDRLSVQRQTNLRADEVLAKPNDPFTLYVWVVVSRERARLYFSDAKRERFLLREVPLKAGFDEFGQEQVAQVLASSARAFLELHAASNVDEVMQTLKPVEERLPAPAADDTPSAPEPPQTVEEERSSAPSVQLGAVYGAVINGPVGIQHGPGVLVGVGRVNPDETWCVALVGEYRFPAEANGPSVDLSLRSYTLRLSGAWEWIDDSQWRFGVDATLGGDYAEFVSRVPGSSNYNPRPEASNLHPMASVAFRGGFGVDGFRVAVSAGPNLRLVRSRYDVRVGDEQIRQIAPWWLEPRLLLEIVKE